MENQNALIPIERTNAMAVFTSQDAITKILEGIAQEARSTTPDLTTAKGRKEIASTAFKIAKSKAYLDGVGKELVAELKELPKQIDASRKLARDYLDNLRDEIRAPLDAWEQEQERIEAERVEAERLKALAIQVEADHETALMMNELWDLNQAELARKAEAERVERERVIAERAAQEAKDKAEREAKARETEQQLALERAERAAKEAEERAKAAEIAAAEAVKRAEEDERRRAEMQARAEAAAAAEAKAREEDREHRKSVNRAALDDLVRCSGISEEQGKKIVIAIATGDVRHTRIFY